MTQRTHLPRGPVINVEITQEIIDQSISRDSNHCMIADAVKSAIPTAKSVSVDLATIRFSDPKRALRYTYLTPRLAQVQLVRFDQGIKPEPFSFQLRQAHVTRSGNRKSTRTDAVPDEKQKAKAHRMREIMKKTVITDRGNDGNVPDRFGGEPPPLQLQSDGVPFTRRRAFGVRALQY